MPSVQMWILQLSPSRSPSLFLSLSPSLSLSLCACVCVCVCVCGSTCDGWGMTELQGNEALGKPLLERALRIQEKALGPTHPDVIAIREVLETEDE
jgi:hypothetical protein